MADFCSSDAQEALDLVAPLVEGFLGQSWIRRTDFHLMISLRQADGTYTVLGQKSFGKFVECDRKYRPIAEGKTAISARTGLSSREVQLMRPDLLEETDVIYWGSAIQGDIIVAGSGVQPWVDEAIAKSCLAICLALLQQRFEANKESTLSGGKTRYVS